MINGHPEAILQDAEYADWIAHCEILYDLFKTLQLQHPCTTLQWLQDLPLTDGLYISTLLLGTAAADGTSQLQVAAVTLPNDVHPSSTLYAAPAQPVPCRITQTIPHPFPLHCARSHPTNKFLVAARGSSPQTLLFDLRNHPAGSQDGDASPCLTLTGHQVGGRCLSWSPKAEGHLLSGSESGRICIWDVQASESPAKAIEAHTTYDYYGGIKDVAWHCEAPFMHGAAGVDGGWAAWDTREDPAAGPSLRAAIGSGCESLAFSPLNSNWIASGHRDAQLMIFDLRALRTPLTTLEQPGHTQLGAVRQVAWDSHQEGVLASNAAGSRRVALWELERCRVQQDALEAEEGPPELMFIHGGHRGDVSAFCWHPRATCMMASASQEGLVQVWQVRDHVRDTRRYYT